MRPTTRNKKSKNGFRPTESGWKSSLCLPTLPNSTRQNPCGIIHGCMEPTIAASKTARKYWIPCAASSATCSGIQLPSPATCDRSSNRMSLYLCPSIYSNVNEVDFLPSGGTHHSSYPGIGEQFVIDNMVVQTPEPSIISLVILGALGITKHIFKSQKKPDSR